MKVNNVLVEDEMRFQGGDCLLLVCLAYLSAKTFFRLDETGVTSGAFLKAKSLTRREINTKARSVNFFYYIVFYSNCARGDAYTKL